MSTEESIIIDPVAMNIVNRIAPGSTFRGVLECNGGLMIQGTLEGDAKVFGGPVVLMQEGVIKGDVQCTGDLFLFGKVVVKETGEFSELSANGAAFLAETMDAHANITSSAIKTYEGAQIHGRISTRRK
jgi:cytoskeletal protein CcmA (bactofilin family)